MLYDARWDAEKQAAPTFKRRWWHSTARLDIRPVLWSLKHRPQDWDFDDRGQYTIVHKPSNHEFWVANGFFFYGLYDARCSCTSVSRGTFSLLQKAQFWLAYKRWEYTYARPIERQRVEAVNVQFSEHFTASLSQDERHDG